MKKVLMGGVAAFVVIVITDFLIHGVIMASAYEATKDLWRSDMMDLMWVSYVLALIYGFCLAWIFSKGYEKKGLMEGVRFGLAVGIMMGAGMGYGTYMMFNIPYSMAIQWFFYCAIQFVLVGVTFSFVFQEKSPASSA